MVKKSSAEGCSRGAWRPAQRWVLTAALVAAVSTPAMALDPRAGEPRDPRDLLAEMTKALQKHSYEGTFVYTRDGRVKTLQITRVAGADGEPGRERLHALTGRAWEVIREPDRIVGVVGERNSDDLEKLPVLTGNAFRRGIPRAEPDLGDHYRVESLGTDRVAGRDAWVIAIEPQDRFRYAHRLWIDDATALPLQTQLRRNGTVLERLLFTEMTVRAETDDIGLEPRLQGEEMVWERGPDRDLETSEEGVADGEWEVIGAPEGFRLTFRNRLEGKAADDRAPESVPETTEHLLYTDGLAHVSIYIVDAGAVQPQRMRVGAMHAYHGPLQGRHVTIVGDVPAETIERFASGLTQP